MEAVDTSDPKAFFGSFVLFSDNFDTADTTNFDAAPLAGRHSGTLASTIELRSWGFQQDINNNELLLPSGSHGVRFENSAGPFGGSNRFDWASGATGAGILNAGGFTVTFDWTPSANTGTQWVSFQVGTVNADSGNLTNDDYGILFRQNGDTERWDNGVNLGAGGAFPATSTSRSVEINYAFSSFAEGSNVTATSTIDGVQIASDTYTWDSNVGEMRMESGHNGANDRINNLTVSTVPEPSSLAHCGLALAGLFSRRCR